MVVTHKTLKAVVAGPNLLYLHFTVVVPCHLLSAAFYGLESKFRNIRNLVLDAPPSTLEVQWAKVVSSVFSNARRVEVHTVEKSGSNKTGGCGRVLFRIGCKDEVVAVGRAALVRLDMRDFTWGCGE